MNYLSSPHGRITNKTYLLVFPIVWIQGNNSNILEKKFGNSSEFWRLAVLPYIFFLMSYSIDLTVYGFESGEFYFTDSQTGLETKAYQTVVA